MNYLKNKQARIYIIIIIIGIAFSTFVFSCNQKQSIANATIIQLDSVESIGTVLSKQIYDYVQKHRIEHVGELEGHIKYLGKERIENLKEVYK